MASYFKVIYLVGAISLALLFTGCATSTWPPKYSVEERTTLQSATSLRLDVDVFRNDDSPIYQYYDENSAQVIGEITAIVLARYGIVANDEAGLDTLEIRVETKRFTTVRNRDPYSVGSATNVNDALARATMNSVSNLIGALVGEDRWEGDGTNIYTTLTFKCASNIPISQQYASGMRTTSKSKVSQEILETTAINLMGMVHQVYGLPDVLAFMVNGAMPIPIREGAALYLGNSNETLKSDLPVDDLLETMVSGTCFHRAIAAKHLGYSLDKRAIPFLIDALDDGYFTGTKGWYPVRTLSYRALKRITNEDLGESKEAWQKWLATQ